MDKAALIAEEVAYYANLRKAWPEHMEKLRKLTPDVSATKLMQDHVEELKQIDNLAKTIL